ncbi:hypothetical protein [Sphingopyxis sp. R3-92]|uniref:hypothetical protein n=1 Tax=Sphingopyxis sp. R3-92 TaxID=3158553 RepID=UPI003EE5A9B4
MKQSPRGRATLTAACGFFYFAAGTALHAQQPAYAGGDAAVGEVRTSLLPPTEFATLYGPDWALLDGQNISSKPIAPYLSPELAADGNVFLPDARGRFLRMVNHGAAAKSGDPTGERTIGNAQGDALASHRHNHQIPRHTGNHNRAGAAGDNRFNALRSEQYSSERSEATGGDETRPRNIAVNFYVRVACTTGGRC